MFHELFGTLVRIFFGIGHGVIGKGVDDGDFGVLDKLIFTASLSIGLINYYGIFKLGRDINLYF